MLAVAVPAHAQSTTVACTNSTNTDCTAKKNQPFGLTADPALTTDTVPTDTWRLYLDGAKVSEQANTGTAPLFNFAQGLPSEGAHTFYLEAVGTCFDSAGAAIECASGPSNAVKLTIVTGSLSAPKNVRIVK
jgi:hypothetical protein